MASKTTKLGFIKPAVTDPADIAIINANFDLAEVELEKKIELEADGKIAASKVPPLAYIPAGQKGASNGVASLDGAGKVPQAQVPELPYIPNSHKGVAGGVVPLNEGRKIEAEFLPPMDYATNTEFDALEVVVAGKETPAGAQAKADAAKSGAIAASDTKGSANAVKTELEPKIALKAPLASPALTGTPTAPTAGSDTNSTQIASTAFVKAAIALLVDSSPDALNTLNELAEALGNDPNFATTMTNLIGEKAVKKIPSSAGNLATLDGAGNLADSGKKAADFEAAGAANAAVAAHNITPNPHSGILATTKTYTATLTAAGWSASAPFTQTVSVSGILAADNPAADVVLSATAATAKAQLEAWGMVGRITTAANSITAYCYDEKPATAIPIQIKAVR